MKRNRTKVITFNYRFRSATGILLSLLITLCFCLSCEQEMQKTVASNLFEFRFSKPGLTVHKLPPFELLVTSDNILPLKDKVYIANIERKEIYMFEVEMLESNEYSIKSHQEISISKIFQQDQLLDFMRKYTANTLGELYIENIKWIYNEELQDQMGEKEYNWIYKVDENNSFQFKIGSQGIDKGSFTKDEMIYRMACDQDNNLLVVIQNFNGASDEIESGDIVQPRKLNNFDLWTVLLFSPKGNLIAKWKSDFCKDFFDIEKGHSFLIEDIQMAYEKYAFVILLSEYGNSEDTSIQYPILLSQKVLYFKFGPQKPYRMFEIYNHQDIKTNSGINKSGLTLWGVTFDGLIILQSPHIEQVNNQMVDNGNRECTFLLSNGSYLGETVLKNQEVGQKRMHFFFNPDRTLLSLIKDHERIIGKLYKIQMDK